MAATDDVIKIYGDRVYYVDPNDVFGYGDEEDKQNKKAPLTPPYEDMCIAFNLIIEKYNRFDANVRNEIGLMWTDKPNGQNTYFSVLDGELKTEDNKIWTPQRDNEGKLINNYDSSYLTTYYTEISPEGYKKKEMVEGLGVQSIQVNFDSYYTPTVVIKFVDVRGSALFGREEAIHSDANGSGIINADNIFGAFFTIPYPKFRLQIKGFYGRDVTYQLTCSNFKANFNAKTGNVEATVTFVGYTWSLLTDIPLAYLIAAPYCNYIGATYWASHENSEDWQMENDAKSNAKRTTPPKLFEFFNEIRNCLKNAGNVSSGDGNSSTSASSNISDERTILEKINHDISEYEKLVTSKKKEDIDKKKSDIQTAHREIINDIERYEEGNKNAFDNVDFARGLEFKENGDEYIMPDYKALTKDINDKLALLDKASQSLIKEERRQFVIKSLEKIGIDPNIKNIFKIIMCHLETFCHILFEANKEIESQKGRGERKPSYLGVDIKKTDMPDRFNDKTDLPAWTAIFNQNENNSSSPDELQYNEMYKWVGSISDKWVEERVVWSLQKAIQHTALSKETQETSKQKKIEGILSLPSDFNSVSSPFDNVSLSGFDTICGSLGIRATQLFGIMDNTLNNNISMVKTLGKIDAYNYYLSCNNTDDIKVRILEKINNGNGTEIVTGVTVCDTNYDSYCEKKNNNGNVHHVFEYDNIENNRQPIFLKDNNQYEYSYFKDENDKKIVPSKLVDFNDRGYNKFIKPKDLLGKVVYEGVVNGEISDGWLYSDAQQTKDIINYDMFNIIDEEGSVNALLTKYDEIKSGNFKIKGYEVNEEEDFKNFIDRYWHLSYEEYKKMFSNEISCTFIGKSYSSYYDNDHKQPGKNTWIKDITLWNRGLDGNEGNTTYTLGDGYGKLKIDSEEIEIDKLFIKSLYVLNTNDESIGSLFGHPLYYTQNQITDNVRCRNAKAFLFLQSLRRSDKYFDNSFNTTHGSFTIYNKLNILYIGGLLWRQKYYDEHKEDGIKYNNPEGGPQYQPCVNSKGEILTIGSVKGLHIFPKGTPLQKCVTIKNYIVNNGDFSLDSNIKRQLIDYFESFAKREFLDIAKNCELRLRTDNTFNPIKSGSEFKTWLDTNVAKLKDHTLLTAADSHLYGDCYAFLYCNDDSIKSGVTTGVYMMFNENESLDIQKKIKDIFFNKVIILNNSSVSKPKNGTITISSNIYETYITSFIDTLRTIHTSQTSDVDEYSSTNLSDDTHIDENMLLAIYLYCKNVWEKWLLPLSGESKEKKSKDDSDMNEKHFDISHFFKNFIFIDAYYNDISKLLKINLDSLLKSYESRSVNGNLFSFIGDIVAEHRCLFVGLPDYVNLGLGIDEVNAEGLEKMRDMFKPIPYSKMGTPRLDNHFVVIYTYPPASKLPDEYSHRFDGFDIYASDSPLLANANKEEKITNGNITKYGYNVPAFAVAFGKQNNHLFKDFSISMDNPVETEQSIKTLYHVAELAKGNDRKVCFYGQDVYNIFSNYSYQIEVEMMGNAQIQPLMYFQLLNIPMWRGAYMIFNVSHTMTPGNMVTRFKAMKMSKNPVPLLSSYWTFIQESYTNGSDPYNEDFSDVESISETFGNLPDKIDSPKEDYLSKKENYSNNNTQSVTTEMRSLFNELYEEIMNMEDNGNGDKTKMKWNIYATSGYRSGSCDHSTKGTLDIHVAKWNNGKVSSVHNSGSSMKEGYTVLALMRKNHLSQLSKGHILIEYNSPTYFETNKDTDSLAMLHTSVKKGCSGDAGPFVIAINNLGGYYKYAVTHINNLGGLEAYLNKIHPSLKVLCKNDFYNLSRDEFNKIWQGVIPMSANEDTLKKYFGGIDNSDFDNTSSPDGFPSDKQLLYMLKNAEGQGLYKWAYSADGGAITSTGVNGYDLAGGVHSSSIAQKIGQTPSSSLGLSSLGGITWKFVRKGTGSEKGNEYMAYKNGKALYAVDSYWHSLIPYYRNEMKLAWQQSVVQAEKDKGTRLAMCHTMYWYYYRNNKFKKDSGWNHRVKIAKKAVTV